MRRWLVLILLLASCGPCNRPPPLEPTPEPAPQPDPSPDPGPDDPPHAG